MRCRLLLIASLATWPEAAAAREIGLSVGASYSSGRYGATHPIRIASTNFGANAEVGAWRVDATIPYLVISTAGAAVDAGGLVLPGNDRGSIRGFGDMTLRSSAPVPLGEDAPVDIRVAFQVKAPTGAAGLSTGKFDGGFDVEVSRAFGTFSPFVSAGYRIYGDGRDLKLADGWALSAGATRTWGKTTVIVSYDRAQSAVAGPASDEFFGIASGVLSPDWGWTAYGSKGLSAGAADFMLGFGITRGFGKRPRAPAARKVLGAPARGPEAV